MRKMIGRVDETYAYCIADKLTGDDITDRLRTRVYESGEYLRLPTWAKSHIAGYCEAKREEVWKYHLVWVMMLDGKLRTSEEVDELTRQEAAILHAGYVGECIRLNKQPATLEKFASSIGHFIQSNYMSPWQRIVTTKPNKSRYVWKNVQGPLYSKPYDRKFIGEMSEYDRKLLEEDKNGQLPTIGDIIKQELAKHATRMM